MRAASILSILGFVSLTSCDSAAPSAIVGLWKSNDLLTLTFEDDGTGLWNFGSPSETATAEFTYELSDYKYVQHITLSNFNSEEMQDITLFGIAEFDGTTQFKVDWEPGTAESARNIRPTDFDPEQTLVFTRNAAD
jgi:hypothetical protein